MNQPYEVQLRQRAESLIEALATYGFDGVLDPKSFETYSVKVVIRQAGHPVGKAVVYYRLKNQTYKCVLENIAEGLSATLLDVWETSGQPSGKTLHPPDAWRAYVDGSYVDGFTGFGVVILQGKRLVEELADVVPAEGLSDNHNVDGEMWAARAALEWCLTNNVDQIGLYFDYEGLEKWATGAWLAKTTTTRAYAEIVTNTPVRVTWEKVPAHSGDRWNSRADQLAKGAAQAAAAAANQQEQSVSGKSQQPITLKAVEAKAEAFVENLAQQGVRGQLAGIMNQQFVRIKFDQGYLDIYLTPRRGPDKPIGYNFASEAQAESMKQLWLAYWLGETAPPNQPSPVVATVMHQAAYYYDTLRPYHDCAFDFGALAAALTQASDDLQYPVGDLYAQRYDFAALEQVYHSLLEQRQGS